MDSKRDSHTLCGWLFPQGFSQEWKLSMKIGIGMMLQHASQIWLQPVSVIFGGHLGKIELDAIALSNSILNVFGNSIALGMCTASDTCFSQAYGGEEYTLVGVILQKSVLILSLVLLLCYSVYINMEFILLISGQDPQVASLCQQYIQICMPGILCLFLYTVLRRYMASQNVVVPFTFIGFAGIGICALFQYICLYILNMGIFGSALGQDIACFSLVVMSLAYILLTGAHIKTWDGFSKECLEEWGPFVKLGIYGIIMLCLEWWSFEITVFLSGLLGTTELGAQAILFNLVSCFASLLSGLSDASGIRTGQTLGGQDPAQAKIVVQVGFTISICLSFIIAICFATFNNQLPWIFTSDSQIVDLCRSILPILAPFMFINGITFAGRGILRGAGYQGMISGLIFLAFYVVGLPIGISLMFLTSFSILGCWIGFTCGMSFLGVMYLIYILRLMDYEDLCKQAQQRIRKCDTASQRQSAKCIDTEQAPLITNDTLSGNRACSGRPTDSHLPRIISTNLILKRSLTCGSVVLVFITSLLTRIYLQSSAAEDNMKYSSNNSSFTTELPLDLIVH